MSAVDLLVVACAFVAVFGFGLATFGLLRLPDLYARAHATSKADTLGTLFAVAAAGLSFGPGPEALKLGVLLAFVLVTTPTATHAIVRAAAAAGHEPWTTGVDGEP